jgi:uracil-DNA glycosylase family 4
LFVGEAPGDSEDVLGSPFKGPAGKLMDRIIKTAGLDSGFALTNLVGCKPDKSGASHDPPAYAIEACSERLLQITEIAKPELIVWVGALSKTWGPRILNGYIESYGVATTHVLHPSAILQTHITQRGLAIQNAIITIADAVEEL